jgi:DNA mismatch repair protein MutS
MSKKTTGKEGKTETPLMQQYYSIKAKYPDALLLFRVGDFYETFGEDAIKASGILGIVLTRRANGAASFIELAGFPHHSIDTYLPKLVRAGNRVAICDQLEDPKLTKTIVKRGVTELITPGVAFNDKILENKQNNFLAAVFMLKEEAGLSLLDVSTGEFFAAQGSLAYIDKLLQNFKPSEILFQKDKKQDFFKNFGNKIYSFGLEEWVFTGDYARETLQKQFGTISLKGFGIEDFRLGIIAAGAALHYIGQTRTEQLHHIHHIARLDEDRYVWLDKFTLRNLELFQSSGENGKALIDIIDQTISPMGSRLMRRWLALPLKDILLIKERHSVVNFFLHQPDIAFQFTRILRGTGDLERLISKVSVGKVTPRELLQVKNALVGVEQIKQACLGIQETNLQRIAEQLNPCRSLLERIEKEIEPEAPAQIVKGGVIAKGVNTELDELRNIAFSGKDYLLKIQQEEAQKTGISSLKVGFTSVFGYYLEVTNVHKDKVPVHWIRKQTLTNAERYITPELKDYEEKILGAEEKILQLESKLFADLLVAAGEYTTPVQLNANLLAHLDCLISLAAVALRNQYVCPDLNESTELLIKGGRHPVIEQMLPSGESYVSNDVIMNREQQQILMITGPNMSGKSALLRQTAIIQLLAQIGSFVPAVSASLGLVDKIFTRVGASDNISSGESTFMVEMNETASILNNLSERSLILLDEIGRGTSTYDGVSIAWSIAEYLHEHPTKAKTLFATHYHELNEMTARFPRIVNFHVSVKESKGKVIFLRKLQPGGSEHSFGIHVAQLAGMPKAVVKRAEEVLTHLESLRHSSQEGNQESLPARPQTAEDGLQLSFFQLNDPVLEQVKETLLSLNINTITPVEALLKLQAIKKMVGA